MADRDPRMTGPTLRVLKFFLTNPPSDVSGADISKATKVGAGTLYPLLARLEGAGWLKSDWEVIDPSEAGRPRRRFYELTGVGQTRARAELSDLQLSHGTGGFAWNR